MTIPYRTRRILQRLCITVSVLVLLAAALLLCWFLWLQRYVVYTENGAHFDFDISLEFSPGKTPVQPQPEATGELIYGKQEEAGATFTQLSHFTGFYIDIEALQSATANAGFSKLNEQLDLLPKGSTVMVDMKDGKSGYTYETALGATMDTVDIQQVSQLLNRMKGEGFYLIARVPAFREIQYFLDDERGRVPYGLPQDGGNGALWKYDGSYWLNPAKDGALTHIIKVINELRGLGFHEVVLDDFWFPKTSMMIFPNNKEKVINDAAATLVSACATDTFAVSFVRKDTAMVMPQGKSRLYLKEVVATDAAQIAQQSGLANPEINVVFFAQTNDTRYDTYCVLRPLEMAR